jgi:hypothetical protein
MPAADRQPDAPRVNHDAIGETLNRFYAVLLGLATDEEIEARDRELALARASDDVCGGPDEVRT